MQERSSGADRIGPRENFQGLIFWPVVPRLERHFPPNHGTYSAVATLRGLRCWRSCHSKNRDHAGRCSASAPRLRVGEASDATRAAAGSTRGITYGLGITRDRCRTRRKIKRNRLHGRSARPLGAYEPWHAHCPALSRPTHHEAALMILRRRSTLRSRNHLDQNYKPSLHRFIFYGGVGTQ